MKKYLSITFALEADSEEQLNELAKTVVKHCLNTVPLGVSVMVPRK